MIPDYQALMLPVLKSLRPGKDLKKQTLIEQLAAEFQLTGEERAQMLPSGAQRTFDNRVGWAVTYLKKAGLVDSPQRAVFRVTDRGSNALASGPARIDLAYLEQFQEFRAFKGKSPGDTVTPGPTPDSQQPPPTPEEQLRQAHQQITSALADDLLDRVKRCSPGFFERLVVQLLVRLGYGGTEADAARAVGRTGDGGIDGTIKQDTLGLDFVHIQAKRYDSTTVGRPAIQQFAGALLGKNATKGVFITTSAFTADATSYAASISPQKVILIDGDQLTRLMIRTGVGVATADTFELKRVDSDYFDEE